jgi:RimJ/RimL family protein N-acetyltransferase
MPSSSDALRIRYVLADEEARLRELRLASLETDPDAFGATYARDAAQPPDWWKQWAAQSEDGTRQRTFVLVDSQDRWLGLALARRDDDRAGSAVVNAMWVSPEARGRRAATSLCDACADWAAERGLGELTLTVIAGNEAARRAYEAAGFVISGKTTWAQHGSTLEAFIGGTQSSSQDGHTLDELIMSRAL